MATEVILYGPESIPLALAGDTGNSNNNVAATTAVAGPTGVPQGPYPLGQQYITRDGRKFRYASAGATTLVVGNTIQGAVQLSTDVGQSATADNTNVNPFNGRVTSNAKGENAIGLTHGAATNIANFFAEGFITVSVTPGGGDVYKIISHVAMASGANTIPDLVNLWPGHKIRRALTDTTSKLDLIQHPYSRVIQTPSTLPTGLVCGVCITPLTGASGRGNFGWLQTRGVCAVLTDNTSVVIGQPVIASTVTPGAVSLVTTTNVITSPIIGQFLRVAASAAWSTIYLTVDG